MVNPGMESVNIDMELAGTKENDDEKQDERRSNAGSITSVKEVDEDEENQEM